MAQQTAVDWLVQQIGQFLEINKELGMEIIEQAKAMEKEQIIKAASIVLWHNTSNSTNEAEQYYNQTYGNEQGSK